MGWDGLKGASSLRKVPSSNSQAPWWLCRHRKRGEHGWRQFPRWFLPEHRRGGELSEQESSRQTRGKVRKSVPGERERSAHCEQRVLVTAGWVLLLLQQLFKSLGLLLPDPQGFPPFCALEGGGEGPGATATGASCGVVLAPAKAKLSIPCDREDTGLSLCFGLGPI